jgi:hypothetical protein
VNNFRYGLCATEVRKRAGAFTAIESGIREDILQGLIADKGGEGQISTARKILAEVIASDSAWLIVFNRAINDVIQKSEKARRNPKALSTLDGYKRPLINSLASNLAKFGFERVRKIETLQEILSEMETEESGKAPTSDDNDGQ